MHSQFAPDPSREAPVNPALKCREEWPGGGDACTSCEPDEDEDFFSRGPITFHVTLPRTTKSNVSLQFNCRDKSSGVLLPSERAAAAAPREEVEEGRTDPFFFEQGYYLQAATGFQVWPGSRLMIEAFTCMHSEEMKCWQDKLANRELNVLELGAGAGAVGTCLAAAGANAMITDLPVLVEHGIWPNVRRNGTLEKSPDEFLEYMGGNAANDTYKPTRIGEGWACPAILDWLKPVSEQLSHTTTSAVDVIVACDCMFLRKLVDPLLHVVDTLFQLSTRSPKFLFTYQRRNMTGVFSGLDELLELIKGRGWRIQCIAWRRIAVEDDGEQELYLFEASPGSEERSYDDEKKTYE
ncbi:hypothetical protein ACHAXT_008340 [Thalassiosira profunda]